MSANAIRRARMLPNGLPVFAAPYAPPDEAIAARLAGAGAARRRRGGAHRRPRDAPRRGDPRAIRRARRHRGFPARVFALHPGGPRPDGAGRGAAARAGCRDRRPADRGQARGRRLGPPRGRNPTRCSSRPRPGRSASSARIIQPGETPENILGQLGKRLGLPAVRTATRQAMRLLGSHFVLGQTIEEALGARRASRANSAIPTTCSARARAPRPTRSAISLPMRARSRRSARRAGNARAAGPARHLGQALGAASALRGDRRASACSRELAPRVLELAREAKAHDLNFTVDAEEADRLELSLDVIARGARRSVACRLGRLRPRGAGLSEARAAR